MRHQFILVLLFTGCLLAQDAASPPAAYVYDHWRTDNGLPTNDVRSVVQTQDGYIWAATVKGLCRFDGLRFHTFNSSNTPAFGRDNINHVCVTKNGVLWIGLDGGGIVQYADGIFSNRDVPPELKLATIAKIFEDRTGKVWVATNDRLYVVDGGTFRQIEGIIGPISDLLQDRYGDLLVVGNVVQRLSAEGVKLLPLRGDIPPSYSRICEGTDGTLWITSGNESLYRVTRSSKDAQGLSHRYAIRRRVNMMLEEVPGSLLISSFGNGVERFVGGRITPIRGLGAMQGAILSARTMARDRENGIWLATGGGLLRMRQTMVWTISKLDGFPDNHVWSVYRANDGTIWAGTDLGGTVNLSNGRSRTALTTKDGLPADRITALQQTSDGSFWFGGYPTGLVRKRGAHFEDMSRFPGHPEGSVRAICEDRRHRVWIGGTSGLYRFDGVRFSPIPDVMKQATARVNSIQEDVNGDIWVCAGRVFRVHGDSVSMFRPSGTAGGFPAWSMLVDSSRVWFGTYGSGLHLIQGDTVVSFERYTKELGPDVLSIMEDGDGKLWVNAEHELQQIEKRNAIALARGEASKLDVKVFGATEGLTDIEFNGSGLNSAARTSAGQFVYASMNGVVFVDPRRAPTNSLIPPVHIQRFTADGRDLPIEGLVAVPAGTKRVDIEFSALTFESIPKVKFRYRLEGIDEDWLELSSLDRNVSYANLKPGSYRFTVIGSNAIGVWNKEGAVLDFSLESFFYETRAFMIAVAIAALSLVVMGFRWRTSALKARQAFLQEAIGEKTSELKDEIEIRKRTEEELRQSQQDLEGRVLERTEQLSNVVEELRRSREQYQKIVDTAQEGIWVTDASETIIYANPKMADILGSTVEEVVGTDIAHYLNADGKSLLEEKRKLHRKGIADRYELEFLRQGGARIWTVISSSPMIEDGGIYQGTLAMVADVTAQKKMESEQQRVEADLRQALKMEAVGQLAGGIAHDFNNLLIPVLGYAELLQKELKHSGRALQRVTVIQQAAQKAALLTRQLLTFSRKQVMELKPLNLSKVIEALSPMLRRTIREDIQIQYRLEADLDVIKGDASQLDQILINLLVNAQDAMPNGGILSIETRNVNWDAASSPSSLAPGRYVSLTVRDTGVGIAPEVQAHVFEPFFTTKVTGKGTGLGLATVYGIVKQHNGSISLQSDRGVGSTFIIHFPAAKEGVPVADEELIMVENLGGTETIAVAEDDKLARQLVTSILEDNGYRVYEAPTVEVCLSLFEEYGSHIDLLLTDVVMPTMNGRQLYTALAEKHPTLKVVYMSGYSEEVISHHGILDDGVSFIQKPFTSEKLLVKIRQVLTKA
jgi:PAS domain S-box-containing protein